MSPSMKNSSPLISLVLLLLFAVTGRIDAQDISARELAVDSTLNVEYADSTLSKEYTVNMDMRGHEVNGVCVMEFRSANKVVGTFMSNFGAKIFDFAYNGKKTKILNLIKPMNRWYIRKVLKKDFNFIIMNLLAKKDTTEKNREMKVLPDGSISITNNKYKIKYLFSEIMTHETDE